jgi:nitroreductase
MDPGSASQRFALRRVRGTKVSSCMNVTAKQTHNRIGVLEELLNERYSVRAFLPKPVPRDIIEHVLATAQRTASWCNSQPWQVLIASGEAKERFRKLIYTEAASGAEGGHDFPPPREYLGVYLERRRESGFQLYNTLGIARGDKAAYAKQALRTTISSAHRMSRSSIPTSRSASTARSIAAPMSAISCWRRRRSGSGQFRRRRWRGIQS